MTADIADRLSTSSGSRIWGGGGLAEFLIGSSCLGFVFLLLGTASSSGYIDRSCSLCTLVFFSSRLLLRSTLSIFLMMGYLVSLTRPRCPSLFMKLFLPSKRSKKPEPLGDLRLTCTGLRFDKLASVESAGSLILVRAMEWNLLLSAIWPKSTLLAASTDLLLLVNVFTLSY